MAVVCLPLVFIGIGFWMMRKTDLAVKTQEAEREYLSDTMLMGGGTAYKGGNVVVTTYRDA